ncbi:VOC family protein [Actinoplanes friuliensis]|uniref:Glyoxalase/bleomycin resistance protein/dioxygenase n=1 Tax=Actinoplanes friuliensis DSM 7358 TaxID=1246995 RepID=U5W0W5_9ACTN|nr:VOC family protein [Actinoplanes friuliensis]AGZ42903.1 glyoxalase/bleomycin resistance protein/dioxygenase [Actinoplanes friuliensis DSM 7358]
MGSHLSAICFLANQPLTLGRFWSGLLGRELVDDNGVVLLPDDTAGFRIRFVETPERKGGQNRAHFDLTSQSSEEQQETVARALELGGRHVDVGQLPEEGHVVLGDPEGNEFCVIEPGNNFLAGTGVIGALAGDGTHAVGCFWSEALGWPLVWDQDEETAIQSPQGGSKITWGGPPLMPRHGRDRVHFDLAPDGDQETEAPRLLALGATRLGTAEDGRLLLADPDGNEFCLLAS